MPAHTVRRRAFEILEPAQPGDRPSLWLDRLMVSLILLSVGFSVMGTVEDLSPQWLDWFHFLETLAVLAFTVEYVARLWTANENQSRRYQPPFWGRIRYLLNPYMLVDLVAILPFYVMLVVTVDGRYAFLFPILRMMRILKLARYSAAIETLGTVLYTERKILAAAFMIMLVLLLFISTAIYVIERHVQPEAYGSIPAAMWWGIVTLTTVGYGDVSPVTPLGKVFGALVTILGVGMFALPAGIMASGFAEEIKQREFLVSWSLVAEVPLFSRLTAPQIAEITRVLGPRVIPAGRVVVKKGEPADEMFFIVAGEVCVEVDPPVLLTDGFFGEIGLLQRRTRTATVRAVTRTRLLVLEVRDFTRLLEDHPKISDAIVEEASRRVALGEHHEGSGA